VDNILIVTGHSHADALARQLPQIPKKNIIIEPIGRNTAPCIGLAALHIKRRDPDDVMVVLPADHLITDAPRFRRLLSTAAEAAAQGNFLLTIGIQPTYPETGYGYLEQGILKATIKGEDIYEVKSIREKPVLEQAKVFLEKGGFYWNSGMFLWRADTILQAIKKWLPDLHQGLLQIEGAICADEEKNIVERVYHLISSISIDYGVMEKADNVLFVKGDFGWSDMGSWDAIWKILEKDEHGNAAHGKALFIGVNAKNSLIQTSRKLVALVGVEDLIVVETEDSLLICKRGCSQDVKKVVEILEHKKMKEFL